MEVLFIVIGAIIMLFGVFVGSALTDKRDKKD